ncbi:hypothetical protein PLICRDRAFT_118028 [Plicaturopsis crispa FD-325 SS-3]|uniref:Mitochondrial import inner membrane translocase subunit n=1 Tax=Plicaturopsis crispa FD-325 SS-3 TaxID=944288 RepID=A0A0C9T8C9_PLICR|nr:hypothetical protein PLICRDRAFT_118028 [Plicaturopsis crispa FD-325 SS-3]
MLFLTKPIEQQRQAVIERYRAQAALQNAQTLMNKATEKCFAKCVPKPSTSLSGSEETCTLRCFERYLEAFNIVSRTYMNRVAEESRNEQHGL